MSIKTWLNRLKSDFRLALVVLFAGITVLGVVPSAAYRFLRGEHLVGTVDVAIVACIALGAIHALRTGRTGGATLFLSLTYSAGCIVVAHIAGLSGLLWVYPVLMANFMLGHRRYAIAVSAAVILLIAASDRALPTVADKAMFLLTATVVCLFAHLFAARSATHRRELEAIAFRDPLTGAINRRGLEIETRQAIDASLREGTPLGLLVLDLDHFKRVNDTLGHEAGDEVLVRFADVVRSAIRRSDHFFRLGGEEFAVLVPGADAATLQGVGDKLRMRVATELTCGETAVTMSVGGAQYVPGESVVTWAARADAAMYAAKHAGRNCTMVDPATSLSAAGAARADRPAPAVVDLAGR